MACPAINLRSALLFNADTGGSWTYNGYSSTFDGDDDNLAQFVGIPASPPEETGGPLVGDNPLIDPSGHTTGFYSFTYSLVDGGCSVDNNVVMPIVETYFAGQDTSFGICTDNNSTYQFFDLISDFGSLTVDTLGTWSQIGGTPNPHPGFNNNVDPTLVTFDASDINHPNDTFPLVFQYTTQTPSTPGFWNPRCPQCQADTSTISITMSSPDCCTGATQCYEGSVPDGTTIHKVLNTGFTFIDSSDMAMNFPYTLPADNAAFEADLNNYLINNGGGSVTVTAGSPGPGFNRVEINNPCIPVVGVCTILSCETYIAFTGSTCI